MKQGPIVIGLYFQKVYDDYRPIFISYPLWKDSLKDCMQFYIFHHEFRNNKNLQLNVPILNHQSKLLKYQSKCTVTVIQFVTRKCLCKRYFQLFGLSEGT